MEHSHVWRTETFAGRTIMSRSLQVYPHKNGKDGGFEANAAVITAEQDTGRPAYALVCREDCTAIYDWTDGAVVPVARRPNEARRFA